MGVQVNLSVSKGSSQLLHAVRGAPLRQFIGEVFGVVSGAHGRAQSYDTSRIGEVLLCESPIALQRAYTVSKTSLQIVVSHDSSTEMSSPASPAMRPERLCVLAHRIAEGTPDSFITKGPGMGDHATAGFVRSLRESARGIFGSDYSEKSACTSAGFRFDFFFPEEAEAVEFAFGLHNPNSEFERDIFKCLLAIDDGCHVKKLMLIGKPGAIG